MINGNQRGMTAIGWLIVLALVGFFALVAIKLLPVYFDAYSVKHAVQALERDKDFKGSVTKREIVSKLQKHFDINNIRGIDIEDSIKIVKDRDGTRVNMAYEVRRDLFGNISVVASFDHQATIRP